ncbi:MAG: S-layer homology domain-containing protein [Candidatus Gracilibacteria bacterium]|nr:S-layer homology domain-containing protein [Candidatus Gracilibacteria bacterium]
MGKMKKFITILSLTALIVVSIPVSFAATFSDVNETNEFYSYIEDLAGRGVVSGIDGMYYPLVGVSRAELTKMTLNGFSIPVAIPEGAPHFTDVPATHTLYSFVETAYGLGIVSGYGDGTFRPDQDILRQEGMKVIMETARSVDTEAYFDEDLTGAPHFSDVPASSEFYGYIETAYNLGIVNGYGNGLFGPRDTMRRDQMAKVVSNAIYVYENGKPTFPVGAPTKVIIEASEDQIYPDGYSTSTITATVVDGNDNRVGSYDEPVTFTTDLGTFDASEDDTVTVNADSGRAQVSLVSGREEGTATVTAETGSFAIATVEVEFSRDAPITRNGFGSNSVSGVGTITIEIIDDKILTDTKSDAFTSQYMEQCGGLAQIQVFVQDDEGDPVENDEVKLTITEGTGALYSSVSDCTTASTAIRSLTISGSRSTSTNAQSNNGRYYAWYKVLDDQAEDTITIEAVNLDTSPTLNVDADLEVVNTSLEATVYHGDIMSRNDSQISNDNGSILNTATIYYFVLDENDDLLTTPHEVEVRFTAGPTSGARLIGEGTSDVGTNVFDTTATVVNASGVEDRNGTDITGLYAVGVLAGSAPGTLTVQARDVTAIGQPYVESTVTVSDPVIDCYASSQEVPAEADSSILCRMTDDDGMAVTGETLRLQIVGGDGSVDTTLSNSTATATAVNMAELTYGASLPTGWYYAEYEAEDNVSGDDTISLNIMATGRSSLPEDNLTVVATDDNPSGVSDLEIVSLRNNIAPSTSVTVLAFAREQDGVGISKLCTGTGATSVDSGYNGILRLNPNTLTNMTINTPVTELGSAVDTSANCPGDGYGNGAYWSVVTSKNVNDAGEVEYELYGSTAILVEDVEEPYNILDNSLTASSTADEILVDQGFGIIVEIIDESNDDPVTGLFSSTGSGITITSVGTTITSVPVIQVGCYKGSGTQAVCNGGAGTIDGTGLYIISVDTAGDAQAGDSVEVTVTYTNQPTNPRDSVDVNVHDIELELEGHPDFVSTTNSIGITAVLRDEDGDPLYVEPNSVATAGVELEISDGSGEICNNNRSGGCSTGYQKIDVVALDSNSAGNNGTDAHDVIYLATYEADVIEESVELTARVQGLNSRAEDSITIDVA